MRSGARPRSAPDRRAFSASADRAPAFRSMRSSRRMAMRCTAPMKALRPPPTMPTRNLACPPPSGVAYTIASALDAEQFLVGREVGAGRREIVEYPVGHLDDVVGDELRALSG